MAGPRSLSRRELLRVGGGVVLAGGLAGCQSLTTPEETPSPTKTSEQSDNSTSTPTNPTPSNSCYTPRGSYDYIEVWPADDEIVENPTGVLQIMEYENLEPEEQEEIQKAIQKQCRVPTQQFSPSSDTELDVIQINESYYWFHVDQALVTETEQDE